MFHPFVTTVTTVTVTPLGLLLLSEALGEATRHLRELVGSPAAALSEGEPLVELRSAEGGVGLLVLAVAACQW